MGGVGGLKSTVGPGRGAGKALSGMGAPLRGTCGQDTRCGDTGTSRRGNSRAFRGSQGIEGPLRRTRKGTGTSPRGTRRPLSGAWGSLRGAWGPRGHRGTPRGPLDSPSEGWGLGVVPSEGWGRGLWSCPRGLRCPLPLQTSPTCARSCPARRRTPSSITSAPWTPRRSPSLPCQKAPSSSPGWDLG